MNFNQELENRISYIEAVIRRYLPEETGYQKTIFEAMNYSILAGGKRLRPMLIHETYKLFGGDNKEVVEPFMAAIEMIHTYSLIHDDLPALDNDDYRRGRKTTHVIYGEAMAILAGDGLLNYAYEVASKAFDVEDDVIKVAKAMKVLARKPGIYGMIGGQVVDVLLEGKTMDKDTLSFVHKNKTGALIECSMMIGAILAGASNDDVQLIEEVASNIGLAFQIQDDILDVTSTMEILGKPIHSDEKNNKITYVTLVGLEQAIADVKRISEHALERIKELKKKNLFLEELIIYLVGRLK